MVRDSDCGLDCALVVRECGSSNRPEGEWPFCATCGAPLPEVAGAGIEVSATW